MNSGSPTENGRREGGTGGHENLGMAGKRAVEAPAAQTVLRQKAPAQTRTGLKTEEQNEENKKKKGGNKTMKYRIRLDTMSDVNKFVKIATAYPGKIMLTDGENFKVSGKSLLGAMYTMEWDAVYCESENEIYHLIKDFVEEE